MKLLINKLILISFCLLSLFSFAQINKYKCLMQMTNYQGEAAYVVVSLINPKGNYEKTLHIFGSDKKWYNTLKNWDKAIKSEKNNFNGITRASISGGKRTLITISLDDSLLNKGYKIRFESAVENKNYYSSEVEIPLNIPEMTERIEGKGYIRFVKLSKF